MGVRAMAWYGCPMAYWMVDRGLSLDALVSFTISILWRFSVFFVVKWCSGHLVDLDAYMYVYMFMYMYMYVYVYMYKYMYMYMYMCMSMYRKRLKTTPYL